MDCCLFYGKPSFPFATTLPSCTHLRRPITLGVGIQRRRPSIVSSSGNKCEFSGLNSPLEPSTPVGRFLSGVLLDNPVKFGLEARKQLEILSARREEAAARERLSVGSDESCLHRRIAELQSDECRVAAEDVMHMLIVHKFLEMRVHLIPRLSKCIYNGRLEIWPSKDWELESIHSSESLEMVREHLFAIVGYRANAKVTDSWVTTKIQRLQLSKVYAASILHGYFLKSVSLRHRLEWGDPEIKTGSWAHQPISEFFSSRSKYVDFNGNRSLLNSTPIGRVSCTVRRNRENLRSYLMGFDQETMQMCAKPKSKEAVNLIERYSCALFGDEKTGLLKNDESICTSFASLKRFVLEGVAFGSFLWETENYVKDVYMLDEN